jgi:lysophospholipase L1-like esterase
MRKKYLFIVLAVIATTFIYMNLNYSHIYKKIDDANLKSPDKNQTYVLGYGINSESVNYVAMGDSLTAGVGADNYEKSFPFLIAKNLADRGNDVVLKNRALPGAKTADLKGDLLDQVIKDEPSIITLLIGVNDIHGNISKSEFKSNYEEILSRLTKETKAKIFVVNIPFLGGTDLLRFPYNFYFDYQTKEFNEVIKNLSENYKVQYIDLYSQTIDEFKKEGDHYSADSFHPSEKGYGEWAKIIYDGINK